MSKITFSDINKIIISFSCLVIFIACGSNKPHPMQYLINRSYLQDLGLSKSVLLLDLKGNEKLKAIHIGTPYDLRVENFLTFNDNGDLTSVHKEKGENLVLKLVEFKYNKHGQLKWIVPHQLYFAGFGYDSLRVEYNGMKPSKVVALKKDKQLWVEDVFFDDEKQTYLFRKKDLKSSQILYNRYDFEDNNMIGEYHRNRVTDYEIDSIRYYYRNGLPFKKSEIFNGAMVQILNYDELGRAKEGTAMFYKKDSVAWVDRFYYLLDDRLPHTITTISPMGWKEETHYFWEK